VSICPLKSLLTYSQVHTSQTLITQSLPAVAKSLESQESAHVKISSL